METINDRMERIVNEVFDGNKAAFAKTIDLPPTGLSNYLGNKRRSKPSVDMAARIVTALDVDARWLLTGEGDVSLHRPGAVANGDHSAAAVNGNATVMGADGAAVLEERIRSLEEQARQKDLLIQQRDLLIAEKERLIRVLLNGRE